MVARRVSMRYSTRKTVELILSEDSESGSEENIVDSGEEFVSVDLKVDLRDSDNNN